MQVYCRSTLQICSADLHCNTAEEQTILCSYRNKQCDTIAVKQHQSLAAFHICVHLEFSGNFPSLILGVVPFSCTEASLISRMVTRPCQKCEGCLRPTCGLCGHCTRLKEGKVSHKRFTSIIAETFHISCYRCKVRVCSGQKTQKQPTLDPMSEPAAAPLPGPSRIAGVDANGDSEVKSRF